MKIKVSHWNSKLENKHLIDYKINETKPSAVQSQHNAKEQQSIRVDFLSFHKSFHKSVNHCLFESKRFKGRIIQWFL